MHVVFDELAEGEVGVALNDDASVYYVVKVLSRRAASREAFKEVLPLLFGSGSAYTALARKEHERLMSDYVRRLREKFAIKFNDLSAQETGPVNYGYDE